MSHSRNAEDLPRILLIGPGAIGGTTAAYLLRAGYPLTIAATPRVGACLRQHGLRLTGLRGDFSVPCPQVVDQPEQAQGPFDLCLIATKAQALPELAQRSLPLLTPSAPIVAMQNGVCLPALCAAVGAERAVGCVITYAASMREPGLYDFTGEGGFIIGRPQPRAADPDLEEVAAALSALGPCRVADNIMAELYAKLAVNAAITALGAASGLLLGQEMRLRQARRLFLTLSRETLAVAQAEGIEVPPFAGRVDFQRLLAGENFCADLRRHLFLRVFGRRYRLLRSSSLQSLEKGQPTEVDYLNGYVAERGQALGVPTPANARLTQIIHEIEAGLRPVSPENLHDPLLTAALWR